MMTKTTKRRFKGTGYIFPRNGTYYLKTTVNGKQKLQSLKTKSKKEAEEKAKEILPILNAKTKEEFALHIAEARKLITKQASFPISDAWEHYLNSPSRPDSSNGTLKGYKSAFNDFCIWIKEVFPFLQNFSEINTTIALEYAKYLWGKRKVSERTYNAYIKTLHLIYRVLIPNEVNPFGKGNIARKTENQQGHKKFNENEIIKLLDSFSDPSLKLMNKDEMQVLFHLGAFTGLRLADCCLLKWENISFHNEVIRCIPLKTRRIKREAIIPITQKLHEQLKLAHTWKNNDYLLPNVAERYLRNPNGVQTDCLKIFRFSGFETTQEKGDLQRKKNICRYGFHSFRHSFASIMASNGYNIIMLAQVLADDTKTLEKYYINIDENTVKKTFNNIFLPDSKAKLISSQDTNRNKLISEITAALKEKTVEELTKISQLIVSL